MIKTIFALSLLCLTIAACDPAATETNSNANAVKLNANAQASPAAAASPAPDVSAAVKPQLKAGDKVKVTTNGSAVEATIVSLDEKAGQVTVKLQGENKEKMVPIGDVVKH